MAEHRIDLERNPRGFGGDTMLYDGVFIGKSEQPIYDAARWLLANEAAAEDDTIATWRDGKLSMHGIVGALAKWTVEERKGGNPSLRLVRWKPFSTGVVGSRTGETGVEATQVAEAAEQASTAEYAISGGNGIITSHNPEAV